MHTTVDLLHATALGQDRGERSSFVRKGRWVVTNAGPVTGEKGLFARASRVAVAGGEFVAAAAQLGAKAGRFPAEIIRLNDNAEKSFAIVRALLGTPGKLRVYIGEPLVGPQRIRCDREKLRQHPLPPSCAPLSVPCERPRTPCQRSQNRRHSRKTPCRPSQTREQRPQTPCDPPDFSCRCLKSASPPLSTHQTTPNMPEQPTTPPTTPSQPAPKTQPRGYFNQAQVEDIQVAEDIAIAAGDDAHQATLATKDITAEYVTGLQGFIAQARAKMAETGQANSGQQPSSLNAEDAERALITVLQGIQSAAKQRHRMEQEDENPATNFQTDGYLIGQRLNPNRALLLQNADTLKGKAGTDQLPGFKPPEAIATIAAAIKAYKDATADKAEQEQDAAQDRIERDTLVRKINSRRMAIHACRRPSLALPRRSQSPHPQTLQPPAGSAV